MDKEQLVELLKSITEKKEKAVTAQSYEMASMLRDKEKELIQQLEQLEKND